MACDRSARFSLALSEIQCLRNQRQKWDHDRWWDHKKENALNDRVVYYFTLGVQCSRKQGSSLLKIHIKLQMLSQLFQIAFKIS